MEGLAHKEARLLQQLHIIFDADAERARAVFERYRVRGTSRHEEIQSTFTELVEVMGGDKERARVVVEKRPDVLKSTLVEASFEQLVSGVTQGDKEQARLLVEQETMLLLGAHAASAFGFLVTEVMEGD